MTLFKHKNNTDIAFFPLTKKIRRTGGNMKRKLDCNQKGLIAEKHLEYFAALQGYPLVDAHDTYLAYDKAMRIKKSWVKVQVKFCGIKRISATKASVDLRKTGNTYYKPSEVDFIYTHDPKANKSWMIPFKKVRGRTEIIPDTYEFDKYEVTA